MLKWVVMAIPKKSTIKKRLTDLRNALLHLHQKLLDYQRRSYEKSHGRVQSTGKMFTLASSNKDFAWLRSLSELIVGLDGYMDTDKFDAKNVRALLKYTKHILSPKNLSDEFSRLYFEAVQIDPVVLIAHRKTMNVLANKPAKKIDSKKKSRHT